GAVFVACALALGAPQWARQLGAYRVLSLVLAAAMAILGVVEIGAMLQVAAEADRGGALILGGAASLSFGGAWVLAAPEWLARRAEAERRRANEAALLQLARARGGELNPGEVAASFGLDYLAARDLLDRAVRSAACVACISEDGAMLYRLRDFAR